MDTLLAAGSVTMEPRYKLLQQQSKKKTKTQKKGEKEGAECRATMKDTATIK